MVLAANAEDILQFLVERIKTGSIKPGYPGTYIGYKEIHDFLHLPMIGDTYGISLSFQGLADLAEWARDNNLPAVTGLVIDKQSHMPGEGYWTVNNKTDYDFKWWKEQIEESVKFNWDQFLTPIQDGKNELLFNNIPKTPRPTDFKDPDEPARTFSESYRIIRDTELVHEIKMEHQFRCQICGMTIAINNNLTYAEGHHIKPLGEPHNGPDIKQNILCVCPNHHVQLDYGAIQLDKNMLEQTPNHCIRDEFIEYHNIMIWKMGNTT
jgi:hypothetical protein